MYRDHAYYVLPWKVQSSPCNVIGDDLDTTEQLTFHDFLHPCKFFQNANYQEIPFCKFFRGFIHVGRRMFTGTMACCVCILQTN